MSGTSPSPQRELALWVQSILAQYAAGLDQRDAASIGRALGSSTYRFKDADPLPAGGAEAMYAASFARGGTPRALHVPGFPHLAGTGDPAVVWFRAPYVRYRIDDDHAASVSGAGYYEGTLRVDGEFPVLASFTVRVAP